MDHISTAPSLSDSSYHSDAAMAGIQTTDACMQLSVPRRHDNEEPLHSAVDLWTSDPQLAATPKSRFSQSYATSGPGIRSAAGEALTPATNEILEPHPGATCYTAILTQTAKLEQTLAQTTSPPGIDLVLEAERDFWALQHGLFTCTGHRAPPPSPQQQQQEHGNRDPNLISLQSTNYYDQPCLASKRPVLLSLALLADHIICMLEDVFRLAAQAAHTLDKTSLAGASEGGLSSLPARRLQRSCRSVWENPCVPTLMEVSRELYLGDFLVENPVKSKAMRRILSLRVDRMLQALQDMRAGRYVGEQDAKEVPEAPLAWVGSKSLISDAADTLVDDLIRRVESLQGAMILIRNDSTI